MLDIGANTGQFAQQLRSDLGYTGKILSFEPQRMIFETLKANAEKDPAWEAYPWAVGDTDGTGEIHISGNPLSSSFLAILPRFLSSAPAAQYVDRETVEVRKLDSFFGDLCRAAKNIYLKIDTQGYESRVLKGAEASLKHIHTVQLEMSLVPLYDGELLAPEMCGAMCTRGYDLVSIEEVYADSRTGQLLQVDGVFHRF